MHNSFLFVLCIYPILQELWEGSPTAMNIIANVHSVLPYLANGMPVFWWDHLSFDYCSFSDSFLLISDNSAYFIYFELFINLLPENEEK